MRIEGPRIHLESCVTQPGFHYPGQFAQRIGHARRSNPGDAVARPTTPAVERQCEPGNGRHGWRRQQFSKPYAFNVNDKSEREVNAVIADASAADHAMHALRRLGKRAVDAAIRPQRVKNAHSLRIQRRPISTGGRDSIRAIASAAMPSPRPAKPSLSVVFAFTFTRSLATARSAALLATLAGRCGA